MRDDEGKTDAPSAAAEKFDPWTVDYEAPGRLELKDRYGRPELSPDGRQKVLYVVPPDSEAYNKAQNYCANVNRQKMRARRDQQLTPEDNDESITELAARSITGWEAIVDREGKDIPHDLRAARDYLRRFRYVQQQVIVYQNDLKNFMPPS